MNPTQELAAGMQSINTTRIMKLLNAGADIDVQDKDGWTLLIYAVCSRSMNRCTELLQQGASLHVRDHTGCTAWDYLDPCDHSTPFYSLFLQYGADVNQYSPYGWTRLHRACWDYKHPLIVLLLAQGADPRLPILDGNEYYKRKIAYDLGSFWDTQEDRRARLRWDTVSIQEVFILASERGLIPIPSYLW